MRRLLAWAAFAVVLAAKAEPGDDERSRLDPDYAAGAKAIEAKDWPSAVRLLNSAALRDTRNADIHNLLAYAYRNSGELPLAFKHYSRALELNPRHRGAHAYLGEAYLMIGNRAKAEEHLAALRRICVLPCAELGELEGRMREPAAR